MKKFLVRLRRLGRMFLLPQEQFDTEYYKRRLRDISEEINEMPAKDRFSFVNELRNNVRNTLIKERAIYKLKLKAVSEILEENETTKE